MFFEFVTRKNEKVSINIDHILFVTNLKNGTCLIDVEGNDYESNEGYESFSKRLNQFAIQYRDKTCKTYKNV